VFIDVFFSNPTQTGLAVDAGVDASVRLLAIHTEIGTSVRDHSNPRATISVSLNSLAEL
jgi:hypothetical protein